MKPILFNTEMARAIQDDRKTATRRVLKNQDENAFCAAPCEDEDNGSVDLICENEDGTKYALYNKAPYQVGDILYVRESFFEHRGKYYYKADGKHLGLNALTGDKEFFKWRPSIHMPKEAARLFLRVTGVRVERLQDITEEQAEKEGFSPIHVSDLSWIGTPKNCFKRCWDSTIKKSDLDRYGWNANPWVWVYELKRISKEEATK